MPKGDDSEYLDVHQKSWSNVAIDAITVDIKSESVVNVMVPAAPLLLSPHWSWINCEDHPESDPALLCQELSLSAARYFTRSPYSAEVGARHPGTTFKHISGRHKKQLLQLGDDVTLLQQANSDRPFFALKQLTPSIVEGDDPLETELWHMYCAMGLPGQHPWQQSVLARCYDFHGAACILRAIDRILDRKVYSGMVSQTMANTDGSDASAESLRRKFRALLSNEGVTVLESTPDPSSAFRALSDSEPTKRALSATSVLQCLPFLEELLAPGVSVRVENMV